MKTQKQIIQDNERRLVQFIDEEAFEEITDTIENHFLSKNELMAILTELNISGYKFAGFVSRKKFKPNRFRQIFKLCHLESGEIFKGIIYSIADGPTWEQFKDVTYESGKDCQVRIILYDEEFAADGAGNNEYTLGALVQNNNKCGIATYLIRSKRLLNSEKKRLFRLLLKESPGTDFGITPSQVPSKREIEEAEFWGPIYIEALGIEMDDFDTTFLGDRSCYDLGRNLETIPDWTDEGFFLKIVAKDDNAELLWLWENKRDELKKQYPKGDIELRGDGEKPKTISVLVDKTPFKKCIAAKYDEKWARAVWASFRELDFLEFCEELLKDRGESKATSKTCKSET